MRRLYVLFAALTVMGAFAAVSASSSFALTSEVLCDNEPITAANAEACAAKAVGKNVLLEESLNKPDIVCEEVTATLTANKAVELPGQDILVTNVVFKGCKTAIGVACTVTALNLPWLSLIELIAGKFVDVLQSSGAGVPGYRASCLGITVECTAALAVGGAEDFGVGLVANEGGTLTASFVEGEKGKCGTESEGWVVGTLTISGPLTLQLSEI